MKITLNINKNKSNIIIMPRKKDPPDHIEGYTICVKCKSYRHNHDEYEVVNSVRMYTCIYCCKRNKKLKQLIMKEKEEEKPVENKLENLIVEEKEKPKEKIIETKEEEPKEEEPIEEVNHYSKTKNKFIFF